MIFEIGKEYSLTFGNSGDMTYTHGVVMEYNHPLIVFVQNGSGEETIFNLASSDFMSAKRG